MATILETINQVLTYENEPERRRELLKNTFELTEEQVAAMDGKIAASLITNTASGAIASFPDGADDLPVEDLVVDIEPVQSGSGEPSPTNVRPISGWTGANVVRTGKNLLALNEDEMTSEGWYRIFPFTIKSGTYNISCSSVFANDTGAVVELLDSVGERVKQIAGSYAWGSSGQTTDNYSFTLTDAEAQKVKKLIFKFNAAGTTFSDIVSAKLMIEIGSAKTNYEPYHGNTYSVDWTDEAGTVYGGTLDVTTGVLTADMEMADLGTLTWGYNESEKFFNTSISGIKEIATNTTKPNMLCTNYKTAALWTDFRNNCITETSGAPPQIRVKDSTYTDADSFKTAMDGVMLVYEIAEPQTYQLSAQEVTTLLGQNNIWADCGDVSVDYSANTKLYIEKLTAPTEDDMTANTNIPSGTYFMVGNTLYLSTTTIPAGDTINPGTNCTLMTLASALNALNA